MELQELKQLYIEGKSLAELSRLSNLSSYRIKKMLVDEGIKIRTRSQQNIITNESRKKPVNENYFSTIDTVNKAWLLGFMAADGSISKDKNEMRINLSSKDEEILWKIKRELDIKQDIKNTTTSKGFDYSYLAWSSKQQKKDLANYGIIHRKTYYPMHLPNFSNNDLSFAFILGYFDGDGCFSFSDMYCKLRIVSHREEILNDFIKFFQSQYPNFKYSLSKDNRDLYELAISTRFAVEILQKMYSLNSISLERKRIKFQEYLEYIDQETVTSLIR